MTARGSAAALLVLGALHSAYSAAQVGPGLAAPPAPARTIDEGLRPSRIDETIQNGFFGDLSRPAPPVLNRIEGVRVPGSTGGAGAAVTLPPVGRDDAAGSGTSTSSERSRLRLAE